MSIQNRKKEADEAYYELIEAAVDKKIPAERLKTAIDAFTTLQLDLLSKKPTPKDIDTLDHLISVLEQEVNNHDE